MTSNDLTSTVDDLIKRQQECIAFFKDIRSIESPDWEAMREKMFKVHEEFTIFWKNVEEGHVAIDAEVSHKISEALNVDHKFKQIIEGIKRRRNQKDA